LTCFGSCVFVVIAWDKEIVSIDNVFGWTYDNFARWQLMIENRATGCKISEKEGKLLLLFARLTIAEKLGISLHGEEFLDLKKSLEQDVFGEKKGVFVTLHLHGELRGCIGNLEPEDSVRRSVGENALNAAFHDPRFPPLTEAEFAEVDLEVSILSKPQPLFYVTPEELVSKLVPTKDGVIIGKKGVKATFLPQVWDQLPRAEEFLSHLCMKAGFAQDEWKTCKLKVMTYQVQCFGKIS